MSALCQKRTSAANTDKHLEHACPAPDLYFQMDRTDAIRLLEALVAAGMNTRAPRANAWIEKKALQIGLEGNQFVSAVTYAGNEGWLADAPQRGWTSLTRVGKAIATR
jgi:hypothetical protein